MRRFIVALTMSGLLGLISGCAEKDAKTKETTVKTPGGTTKVTEETKIEKTGDHKTK